MTDNYDAIVVGAGHNGLVCSALLAKAGKKVLVLEANDQVGGAAVTREFADGYSNSVDDESQDVAAFLMWAAEPKMMARKQAGFLGVLFLTVLTVLLYLTNKQLWAPHKGKKTS